MAATGSARAVPVGGYGTFEGVMLGDLANPRVEGRFVVDRVRAWNVTWGHAEGEVVVHDAYADLRNTVVTAAGARMDVEGRFSLGYPRRDRGEELDARVFVKRWPIVDMRNAFELYDYPVDGLGSGEFHLYDKYEEPLGFGRLVIETGTAYDETFDRFTAGLRFEGTGVRLDAIEIEKGAGRITGAAWVGWDGTYSFNADGQRIAVESLYLLTFPQAPLTGQLEFSAVGNGLFENPRYEVRGRVDDLYVFDEGIGLVRGGFSVRDEQFNIDQFEVASPRLAVSGSGRIALTDEYDADIFLRFSDTSLDPYVRAVVPALSPFTTAVASGTLRLLGELNTPEQLRADVVVDELTLGLFDYAIRNDGPVRVAYDRETISVDRLRLVGEGTQIELVGDVGVGDDRIALRGLGDANLGILQGLLRDIRSSGAAEVQADIRGRLSQPTVYGALTIFNGRMRHFALPHALEAINGRLEFDSGGLRLDGLSARMGGGAIRFGGRVGFDGLAPTELAITATGEEMRLRYPEGFRSIIDADLALRGELSAPVLAGTVTVRSSVWNGGMDTSGAGMLGLAAVGGAARPQAAATPSTIPLRFDLRLVAPSALRIENRAARLLGSAELTLRGDYDRPLLFGRAEIERGTVLFEGHRYQVTRGTVDFANPARIEPFFDLEAETRARVPGQVYRVVFRASGTPDRFGTELTSDPPLAPVEILSLLFGGTRSVQDADLRALRAPGLAEQELVVTQAAQLLASPVSSNVQRVVEETFGVDTVRISPSFGDLSAQETLRLNPSARVIIGKRISEKLYLTYSRAISTSTREQIILVEYDQTDRLAWVVSQNENGTYALDLRVRHVF
jgi:autotransporter translocation and assembly factor TamB